MSTPLPHDDAATRDGLIDRVASGDLSGRAWAEWSRHAGDETAAWRTMAESLRDQLLLIDAAVAAADVADRVALPLPAAGPPPRTTPGPAAPAPQADHPHTAGRRAPRAAPRPSSRLAPAGIAAHRPLARARGAAGWLVSAMLVLAMVTLSPLLDSASRPGTATTGGDGSSAATVSPDRPATAGMLTAGGSASDALSLYLERGRDEGIVVQEQPELVMLGSRPTADGDGYELLYVRQIVERTVVPELFVPTGHDGEGRPVVTRIARRPASAF